MIEFSHFDESGASRMVDTSAKQETERMARASAIVRMAPEVGASVRNRQGTKGNVLEVARLAGILAAKKTADLIPLCHPIPLTSVAVDYQWLDECRLRIESRVRCIARTGVEMEALVAVALAALTVYDMCKSADRTMTIECIQLEEKAGGRTGHFVRASQADG